MLSARWRTAALLQCQILLEGARLLGSTAKFYKGQAACLWPKQWLTASSALDGRYEGARTLCCAEHMVCSQAERL